MQSRLRNLAKLPVFLGGVPDFAASNCSYSSGNSQIETRPRYCNACARITAPREFFLFRRQRFVQQQQQQQQQQFQRPIRGRGGRRRIFRGNAASIGGRPSYAHGRSAPRRARGQASGSAQSTGRPPDAVPGGQQSPTPLYQPAGHSRDRSPREHYRESQTQNRRAAERHPRGRAHYQRFHQAGNPYPVQLPGFHAPASTAARTTQREANALIPPQRTGSDTPPSEPQAEPQISASTLQEGQPQANSEPAHSVRTHQRPA